MKVKSAQKKHLPQWVNLRKELWPDFDMATLTDEAQEILDSRNDICYLLFHSENKPIGFVEAKIYTPKPPHGPYCHIEGWYIKPEFRGRGYGKQLIDLIEDWALHHSIEILTSDTIPAYPLSPPAHAKAGFRKIHEMTIFIKDFPDSKRG